MRKVKKPLLTSMQGKPSEKPYRTGEKNGEKVKSTLDRLVKKTKHRKKAK